MGGHYLELLVAKEVEVLFATVMGVNGNLGTRCRAITHCRAITWAVEMRMEARLTLHGRE